MSGTRYDDPADGRNGADPFAELVDLIEDPQRRVAGGDRQAAAYDGFAEPAAEFSFHGYDDAALDERRPYGGTEARGEIDDDLDALIGLSEPATPRIALPAEAAAFAPASHLDEDEPAAASSSALDDFDALIASEMAALRPPVEPEPLPVFENETALEAEPEWHEAHEANYAAAPMSAPVSARALLHPALGGPRRRRAMFVAGGAAAVALVAAFGVYAGSGVFAGAVGGGGDPILIRADTEPVKIAPVDPGGRVVPNQNKAVYERVARNTAPLSPALSQDMLISAAEEPLDISFEDQVSNLPGVMVGVSELPLPFEDRPVEVAQAETPSANPPSALQPHRVRTFDVRPDGTLVPREAPAEASPAVPDPVEALAEPAAPLSLGGAAAPEPQPAPAAETQAPPPAAEQAPPAEPATAAVEQPAPPPDAYFVQISSQPSEALARESMASLSGRFSSIIGDRGMTIQSAEIPDRGTFYRVRITAASRQEANTVCENLQSAGGSCFVTR